MRPETRRRPLPSMEQLERQARAVELRAAQRTFPEIAQEMGVSLGTAHNLVARGMKFYLADHGAEVVKTEMLARLATGLRAVMPRVVKSDDNAIRSWLAIENRLADLLGLDAPKTLNHTGEVRVVTVDALDAEIAALSAELASGDAPGPLETGATEVAAEA